jgi:CRP-like cAMP-binding protein
MKQPSALERFVDRLRLRSPLSDKEVAALLALEGREVRTKARNIIVRPGQDVNFACLVVQGFVSRFDQLANGGRQITALHIPGDMCDLHSLAVPHAGWGIEALTDARVLRIPHEQLRELAETYPAIAFAFWRDTVADASILAKWVSILGGLQAKERLAHLICEMGLRMEWAHLGRRTEFSLPLSQTQIADVLGLVLTRAHTCLKALQTEGVIDKQGSLFHVADPEHLAEIAEFDPTYLLLERAAA